MFETATDYEIIAFGTNKMTAFDPTGDVVATAVRTDGDWTVHSDGVDDSVHSGRNTAIDALKDRVLAIHNGDGCSIRIPRGLRDQP